MPETSETTSRGNSMWLLKDKHFVWERSLRKADCPALGSAAPCGPVLGARVEHLGTRDGLQADNPRMIFTTPHFDDYPSVLVRLDEVSANELQELIVESWLAQAPKRLAHAYLAAHPHD